MITKSNKKYYSTKQEKDVARCFDAKTTVASGAFWGMKGDVRSEDFLIECKTTGNSYYTFKSLTWEKISSEALKDRMKTPLLVIDFHNSHKERFVCFSADLLELEEGGHHLLPEWVSTVYYVSNPDKCQYRFKGLEGSHPALHLELKGKKYNMVNVIFMRIEDFIRFSNEAGSF